MPDMVYMNKLNDFKYSVAKADAEAVLQEVRRCLVAKKPEEALVTVQEYLTFKNIQIHVDNAINAMREYMKENKIV